MNPNFDSHEPLIDSALIGLDLTAEHHLSNCPCCQGEREKTEQALRRYAEFERDRASRPESFWDDQAARIRAARSKPGRLQLGAVLVPALALLVVLVLELAPQREPLSPLPTVQAQSISDHDLLIAVERAVDNGMPYALQPVALAVDQGESGAAVPKQNVPSNKMIKEFNSHAQ